MNRVSEPSAFIKVKDSHCPTTVAVAQWLERYVNESCKHKLGNVTNHCETHVRSSPPVTRKRRDRGFESLSPQFFLLEGQVSFTTVALSDE